MVGWHLLEVTSAWMPVLRCLTGGSAHPRVPDKTALPSWRTPCLLQPWWKMLNSSQPLLISDGATSRSAPEHVPFALPAACLY